MSKSCVRYLAQKLGKTWVRLWQVILPKFPYTPRHLSQDLFKSVARYLAQDHLGKNWARLGQVILRTNFFFFLCLTFYQLPKTPCCLLLSFSRLSLYLSPFFYFYQVLVFSSLFRQILFRPSFPFSPQGFP